MKHIFILLLVLAGPAAQGKDVHFLFLGNSYTYNPGHGTPNNPAIPRMVKAIAESIDPTLNITYEFNTPGGHSFYKHYHDPRSRELMAKRYDKVILQGFSIGSLDLPSWWESEFVGEKYFSVYLPKILQLVFEQNRDVTLFVNWGWNFKEQRLQGDHPGLVFTGDSIKAGQMWCGRDKYELQGMIDQSYMKHSADYPVQLSLVGDAWLAVQDAGLVNDDDLYIEADWSHPSVLGGFVTALVLARDTLQLDISRNRFVPKNINPALASRLQAFLAPRVTEI